MVSSLNEFILQMLKWRRKRGVTAFLPPPGGPIAEISCMSISVIFEVSLRSYLQDKDLIITAKNQKIRTDNSDYSVLKFSLPVSMVKILTKQLDWRLCTKNLFCWHIHVIHKNDAFLSHGRSIYPLSPFV